MDTQQWAAGSPLLTHAHDENEFSKHFHTV